MKQDQMRCFLVGGALCQPMNPISTPCALLTPRPLTMPQTLTQVTSALPVRS